MDDFPFSQVVSISSLEGSGLGLDVNSETCRLELVRIYIYVYSNIINYIYEIYIRNGLYIYSYIHIYMIYLHTHTPGSQRYNLQPHQARLH